MTCSGGPTDPGAPAGLPPREFTSGPPGPLRGRTASSAVDAYSAVPDTLRRAAAAAPARVIGGNPMPFTSGKRAFLDLLRQEGVEYLFGNPGTTELPLMDGLAEESALTYVLGLQEAAVIAMADGYAQASGKLGVVSVHVAPGLGNALGMLYDAQKAGAPLLVTAGQHDQTFNVTEPILWADLPPIARPFVKWSTEVRRLEDLPRLVHRAAKTALAPPAGPVFLSLPADVLQAEGVVEL